MRTTPTSRVISIAFCLLFAGSLLFGRLSAQASQLTQTINGSDGPDGIYRGLSSAVKFDVSPPLSSIAPIPFKPSKEAEIPERPSGLEGPFGPQDIDPLVQTAVGPSAMPAPMVSFDGPPNVFNVSPPDPVGDVGPNHYVAMSNLSFQIFDKSGNSLYGPAANNTLWAAFGGSCETENSGDPIVVYDQLADRWLLTQFTSGGPTYYNCVALSTSGDPTGSYYRYAFSSGTNFPDYPKYGVWPDAYYLSTREFAGANFVGMGAYALNRAQMLIGNPTPQVISFLVPPGATPYNIGDGLLPADLDGSTPPPAGSPNYFVGAMDNGGPYGAPQDALVIWEFDVDFTTPPNSSFLLAATLPIAAYDTIFPCSPASRYCIPQPGTTNKVDILSYRQRPMWRLAYRNFGTHESLVTNQAVEAAANVAGIRWWEIRSPDSSPFIYQEGTYAPGIVDGIHRWMGSIAMDSAGNMALGYSASDGTSTFPSVWYTGRLVADPLGTLPQGESSIINGTGSQTGSQRWGDYTSMNVDPVDDCTFWYVNQYLPVSSPNGWQLRIGAFKYDACGSADFGLQSTPTQQGVCIPSDASYDISVDSYQGFSDPVTLSTSGEPAGTIASFFVNPVTPPGNSLLTIGNTGAAAAGSYTVTVTGVAPTSTHSVNVDLHVFDASPGQVVLSSPAQFAINQPRQPTFSWLGASQAGSYDLEVSSDSLFSTLAYTATGLLDTTHTASSPLDPSAVYYWRVRAHNACGSSAYSSAFVFITAPEAGSCPLGSSPNAFYSEDFESGAAGWTHSGTGDTWALSGVRVHSGANAFYAVDPATISDQLLVSPAVALPSGQDPLLLSFWNYQAMENRTGGCYDGGILEITTDGGANWTQVPNSDLLTDPYDGPISAGFGNPLANLNAWCGSPQDWLDSLADVSAYAGQTAQFRFRLGSDNSVSREGWYIDDVAVRSCEPGYLALLGSDQSQITLPLSSVDYLFTLLNLGQADNFYLNVSGNAWPTTLQGPSTINVGSGSQVTITVRVATPGVVPDDLDVSDTFILEAVSSGDPTQNLQATGTTRSWVVPGAELSPASQSQSGTPGSEIAYTFAVSNTGNYTDTFDLALSGNTWPTSAPASLALGPGESAPVTVQVSIPPQAIEQVAIIVSDSFTLTASSSLASSLSLQASGTTSTTANPAVNLVSDSASLEGVPGQVVVYQLTVTNDGDFPDSFDLASSGNWKPTLSAASTGTLSPGASASAQLSVTIPISAADGASEVTTLTATSALDAAIQATIQVTTTARYHPGYLATLGSDQSQITLPDSNVDYVFTLLNLGQADSYNLNVSGNAWPTTLQGPSTINVGSGSQVTITVRVATPGVVPDDLDVSDTFILEAVSSGDPTQNLQATGTTRSWVVPGAELSPASQSQSGTPGSEIAYTFAVSNTGNYTDTFDLIVSGNTWPTSAPASLALGPGESAPVNVQVSIPPQAIAQVAIIVSDSFTLTASSSLASSLSLQASGTTSTAANPAVNLVSDSASLEGVPGQVVVYQLTVTNDGDFPDSFDLASSGNWNATLSAANTGTLSPGASASVQLSVTIPISAATGASDVTTLTATSALDVAVKKTIQVTTTVRYYRMFVPLIQR